MLSKIMKKHLRILYGCDDRFEITKKDDTLEGKLSFENILV